MPAPHLNPFLLLTGDLQGALPYPSLSASARIGGQLFAPRVASPSSASTSAAGDAFSAIANSVFGQRVRLSTIGQTTYQQIQPVSATSRVLGRKSAGSGVIEECTLSEVLDFISSAAQGDILYRGASAWARLGAGTANQFLKTQGTGANPVWANPASGSVSPIDPANRWDLFDDCDSVVSSAIGGQWLSTNAGAGSAINRLAVADHPGVIEISTGSTNTGSAQVMLNGNVAGTATNSIVLLGSNDIVLEGLMRIPTLPSGSETFTAYIGMREALNLGTSLVSLQCVWNGSTVIWQLVTRNNAGSATTSSAGPSTPQANTWHYIKIVMNTTSVTAYIDGVSQASNTLTLPDAGIAPVFGNVKSVGSTARTAQLDFIWLHQDFASARFS